MTNRPDRSTTETPAGTGIVRPPKAAILSPSITITESGTVVPATTSMAVAPFKTTRFTAGACWDKAVRLAAVASSAANKKTYLIFIYSTENARRTLPGRIPP